MMLKVVFKHCVDFMLVIHGKCVRFHLPSYVVKHCHARFWQLSLTNNRSFLLKQKCSVSPSNAGVQLLRIQQALESVATRNQGTAPRNHHPGEWGEVRHQFKLSFTQNLAPRKQKQNFPPQKLTFPVIRWYKYTYCANIHYFVLPGAKLPDSNIVHHLPFAAHVLLLLRNSPRLVLATSTSAGCTC